MERGEDSADRSKCLEVMEGLEPS